LLINRGTAIRFALRVSSATVIPSCTARFDLGYLYSQSTSKPEQDEPVDRHSMKQAACPMGSANALDCADNGASRPAGMPEVRQGIPAPAKALARPQKAVSGMGGAGEACQSVLMAKCVHYSCGVRRKKYSAAMLAPRGLASLDPAVPPLPGCEGGEGEAELMGVKVGPVGVGEVELGVGALPQ